MTNRYLTILVAADPQEGSTSFQHRIMLLQHTGTYCPNCPTLMSSLKEVAEEIVKVDIPALTRSGAYPASGF